MTFTVKDGRYGQESKREGKQVRSIYLGKTGVTERVQRPTKIDLRAGDQLGYINEKIRTLYAEGKGDKKIARILLEEDQFEASEFAPFGPNVIRTQRHRMGVPDRAQKKPEPKTDWEAIATKQETTIDELNRSLKYAEEQHDVDVGRLQQCREENYSMKYPSV